MSEEMSNSAILEDEAANDAVVENSDADAAADGVLLQLTVEDDPDPVSTYSSSSIISPVPNDSVITKSKLSVTGCSRNISSSVLEKNSSVGKLSQSDVAAAQAKVFRQYLLAGDVQARILELDKTSKLGVCVQFV